MTEFFKQTVEMPVWVLIYLFFHIMWIRDSTRWFVETVPSRTVHSVSDLTEHERFMLAIFGPPAMWIWCLVTSLVRVVKT